MQVGLTTASAGLHDAQLIATLARKQDEVDSMTTAMAQLFVYGHDLDFRTLFLGDEPRRLREHPADPLQAQAALAGRPVHRRQLGDDAGQPRRHARRPPRLGVRPAGRDRSRGAGESRCGAGASGRHADRVRAARGARRGRPAGDDADPAPRRREGAGARPHRRVVHVGLRRDRQPRRPGDGAADCRRGRSGCGRSRRSAEVAAEPSQPDDDAEILQRQPHPGRESRCGLCEVVAGLG